MAQSGRIDDEGEDDLPTPPKLLPVPKASEIRRTSADVRTWNAWTGTVSDLEKVAKRFEEMAAARKLETEAMLKSGNQTAAGPFAALRDEIDPRTWTEIVLKAGREWDDEYLKLRIRRRPIAFGQAVVELQIASSDQGATASAMSQLSAEIELSKPRWAWVHTTKGSVLVACLTSLLALNVPLSLAVLPRLHFGTSLWITVLIAFLIASVAIGVGANGVIGRALPPAEIRYDSAPASSGTRFVGGLVGLVIIPILISVAFVVLT